MFSSPTLSLTHNYSSVRTRGLVVVVVLVAASTNCSASSVLLHPDASLPLLPEQEGDARHGLGNLTRTASSFSALQDTEYGDNGGFFLDEFEAVTRYDNLVTGYLVFWIT